MWLAFCQLYPVEVTNLQSLPHFQFSNRGKKKIVGKKKKPPRRKGSKTMQKSVKVGVDLHYFPLQPLSSKSFLHSIKWCLAFPRFCFFSFRGEKSMRFLKRLRIERSLLNKWHVRQDKFTFSRTSWKNKASFVWDSLTSHWRQASTAHWSWWSQT